MEDALVCSQVASSPCGRICSQSVNTCALLSRTALPAATVAMTAMKGAIAIIIALIFVMLTLEGCGKVECDVGPCKYKDMSSACCDKMKSATDSGGSTTDLQECSNTDDMNAMAAGATSCFGNLAGALR
jgi:hypothetical protein